MKILLFLPVLLTAGCSLARSQPELKTAEHYRMQYYLSLPEGWNRKQQWPIAVTIEGAASNWRNNAALFAGARGKMPFIIVTPVVITNMGSQVPRQSPYSLDIWTKLHDDPEELFRFDREGVLAVVQEVAEKYSGREKFYLSGFSSGGNLAWSLILNDPKKMAAAALSCASFNNRGVAQVPTASERIELPIKGFQGSNDLLEIRKKQWTDAKTKAESRGFTNFEYEVIQGEGHTPVAGRTMAWFNTLLR